MTDKIQTNAQAVREHAEYIRQNPNNAQAIADALDLIADAMEPCEDCGSKQADAVPRPAVGIDAGANVDANAEAVIAVTTQEMQPGFNNVNGMA